MANVLRRANERGAGVVARLETQHAERLARQRLLQNAVAAKMGATRSSDDPTYQLNYLAKFVEKHAVMLAGKPITFSVPDLPETRAQENEDREFVIHRLDEVWRNNAKDVRMLELATKGSALGDVFARVAWDDDVDDVRVDVHGPLHVFPVYGGKTGVDARTMSECWITVPKATESKGERDVSEYYVERWTSTEFEEWGEDTVRATRANVLGEIPVVHFINAPALDDVYGQSDIEFAFDAQMRFNSKATDIGDIIDYNAAPTTIITGARLNQLEKGANRVWSLPAEASAKNLEMNSDLKAASDFVEHLRLAMHELSNMPVGALGGLTPSDSAVAMLFLFQPLLERRNLKRVYFDAGLQRLNRLILKTLEIGDREFAARFTKLPRRTRYLIANYFPDPLPRDESIELNKSDKRISLGMSTPVEELVRRFGESRKEAERIAAEAREYSLQKMRDEAEIKGSIAGPGSGNPNPKRPDPNVQGASRSRTVEERAAAAGELQEGGKDD